jgi:hypothetical protein
VRGGQWRDLAAASGRIGASVVRARGKVRDGGEVTRFGQRCARQRSHERIQASGEANRRRRRRREGRGKWDYRRGEAGVLKVTRPIFRNNSFFSEQLVFRASEVYMAKISSLRRKLDTTNIVKAELGVIILEIHLWDRTSVAEVRHYDPKPWVTSSISSLFHFLNKKYVHKLEL